MKRLKATKGLYFFSFFTLEIDEEVDDLTLDELVLNSTTVHELFHFVQDMSTSVGMANLCNTTALLARYHNSPAEIRTSFPVSLADKVSRVNQKLFEVYLADNQYCSLPAGAKFSYEAIPARPIDRKNSMPLVRYTVLAELNFNRQRFTFSGMSILEGMARIFENYLFPATTPGYDIPYDFPSILVDLLHPTLGVDRRFIFSLCDASLMYFDSAFIFVETLKLMNQASFQPSHHHDVYKFVFAHFDLQGKTILNVYLGELERAIHLTANILNSNLFEPARGWVATTLKMYAVARQKNICFLSDMIFRDREACLTEFYSLIRRHGSPLILDRGANCFLLHRPSEVPVGEALATMQYWAVLRNLFVGIFDTGHFQCPFMKRCKGFECSKLIRTQDGGSYCIYAYGRHLLKLEEDAS